MFDIGFWELFFLFLLALFVLGPERLPVVASYLGKQFGKVQRYFSNVKNQIDDEVLDPEFSWWSDTLREMNSNRSFEINDKNECEVELKLD